MRIERIIARRIAKERWKMQVQAEKNATVQGLMERSRQVGVRVGRQSVALAAMKLTYDA